MAKPTYSYEPQRRTGTVASVATAIFVAALGVGLLTQHTAASRTVDVVLAVCFFVFAAGQVWRAMRLSQTGVNVTDTGLEVVNPWRTVRVPWRSIDRCVLLPAQETAGRTLYIECADRSAVKVWGIQEPRIPLRTPTRASAVADELNDAARRHRA